ncbi:MAG TPA: hypothetical protein VNS58_00195 [Puia sp.]|nr:hypothetical protein [Puia sp.]
MPQIYYIYILYFAALYLSCFLTGCLLVRKSRPLEYKLLVVLSGLTLVVETVVTQYDLRRIDGRWMYIFFAPVECGFIIYILYRASVHPNIKRLNAILLGLLPISIGIAYWLHPAFSGFNDIADFFYDFLELIAACSFLTDVLLNKSDTPVGRQPLFWMASGILFYCCMFTLLGVLLNYMPRMPRRYLAPYSLVANTFMYTGFIACFICLHRARRRNVAASPYHIH